MLLRAFGVKVDQHVYEGILRILYYDLPDSHVAQVLSYMVDRDMAVIKNEMPDIIMQMKVSILI